MMVGVRPARLTTRSAGSQPKDMMTITAVLGIDSAPPAAKASSSTDPAGSWQRRIANTGCRGRSFRLVAVGGSTRGELWTRIFSDVTGREQEICTYNVGGWFGVAHLIAATVTEADIDRRNPITAVVEPRPEGLATCTELYGRCHEMKSATADVSHFLADRQMAGPNGENKNAAPKK